MRPYQTIRVIEQATDQNFNEETYRKANPDVAEAIKNGSIHSGHAHFLFYGKQEGRQQFNPLLAEAKRGKQTRIQRLLKEEIPHKKLDGMYDFLTDDIRKTWGIIDAYLVSSNGYDQYAKSIIERNADDMVLDAGAGYRADYYPNVINFEIEPYESTDVLGVGEELPFKDNSIDAVISSAVLEHVKDPFRCAKEITRVLKPGGELYCCVPFLQPYHGYPNHYYNMTHQGLSNLFQGPMVVDHIEVLDSTSPIWTLTWFLDSWIKGLPEANREEFLNMKVSDLLPPVEQHLTKPFVTELSQAAQFELASAFVLFAHKKHA